MMTFDPDHPDDEAKKKPPWKMAYCAKGFTTKSKAMGCCRPWDSTSDREAAPSEGFCNEFNQKSCSWPKGFVCTCRVELVIQADGSYRPLPADRLTSLVRSRQPCICNAAKFMEAVNAEKEEVAGTQTGSKEPAAKRGRPAKATLSESDFLLADEFAVLSAHHGWVEEPQERAPGFYNANDAVASAYTTFRDSHLLEMQDGQDPSDALSSDVERRRMLMLRLWQNIRNMRQLEPSYVEAALKEGVERHGLSDLQ
jgi:hypothetical protein